MEENFVGYLLNALDADTHRDVESYLAAHPEARQRADLLRRALEPLAADAAEEPSPGLWLRTLAHVARHEAHRPDRPTLRLADHLGDLPPAPRPAAAQVVGPSRSRWRRADVLVAAVLLFAVVGLGASLLPGLWYRQQVLACQNNLRQFHQALMEYSQRHGGAFPKVENAPPRNVAGIFVPILEESGTLPDDVTVACPADGHEKPPAVTLAELEELHKDRPSQFDALARRLAGCYAYSLGYGDPGAHAGLRADDDDNLPILSDAPAFQGTGVAAGNSPNHGGRGQNVLYIDGHARFSTTRGAGVGGDDIFVNQQGRVGAGFNRYDSVLGASAATPFPYEP
jgi:hypothetical protein